MVWADARRYARVAFRELSFQAVYAIRQGNVLPTQAAEGLVPRAARRVTQSKLLVSFVLGLLTVGAAAFAARATTVPFVAAPLTPTVIAAGVVTGLLALDAAFLWWTGLQVLPTLLSSSVVPVLDPLPIDAETRRQTLLLVYLRLFDLPVATVVTVTPVVFGIALGPLAGIAVLPGAVSAAILALALSLTTGRFFVRRIQGMRGGGGRTVVRWAYLLLWLIPSFAILGFLTAATEFLAVLGSVAAFGPPLARALLYSAYPVPFGLLTGVAAHGYAGIGLGPLGTVGVLVVADAYFGLVLWAAVWLYREVGELGHLPLAAPSGGPVPEYRLRPWSPAWAVIQKDLRVASRTPGYAFLLLLPLLDAVALGLLTLADAPGPTAATGLALGAVTAAALLATFFGPAFFAIEVLAYSYGRTLPLADRSVIAGKVILVAGVYSAASAIVLLLASARVAAAPLFLGFAVAELPAVVAAACLELGWLFRTARRRGFPIANLYSGAWTAILVALPGLVIAGLPLALSRAYGIEGMGAAAIVELAVCLPFALGGSS